MDSLNLQKIPLEKLNPAAYNPRKDLQPGDAEYEKLLASIEEFGYVDPIIWNERTGNVVGGHQRLKILIHLGYTAIDVVVVDLDELREKALNVALNKIQGEWDAPKLAELLQDLEKKGFRLDLTGHDAPEIDKIFQQFKRQQESKAAEDDFNIQSELDSIDKPLTRRGDIWLIGRHRLMCGDSTDICDVARLMDGRKSRMVFTDPPWNVDYGGGLHPSWKQRSIMNDKMSTEDFYGFLLAAFKSIASVSEQGTPIYVVMSAQEWPNVHAALLEGGYHWSSTIIWAKDKFVLSRKDYNTQYEPIWYGWLDGAPRLCQLKDAQQSDLWQFDRPTKSAEHPTMKPITLVARAINNSSHHGDIILDVFGGSGTTLIAAEQCDRSSCLMELDPKYCDVIVKRAIQLFGTDDNVYLLRDGEKIDYRAVPDP
ncbi:adenine methyltransferase [Clostridia bacterium]|nr:adenine methyltransferase [Clostridia bacterium]